VKKVMAGTWKAESYWEGMNADIVRLAPLTANAPDGAAAKVEDIKKKILAGKFDVFAGPIKDQSGKVRIPAGSAMSDKEQLSCDWFLKALWEKLKGNKIIQNRPSARVATPC
jgi:basic membrane protein A